MAQCVYRVLDYEGETNNSEGHNGLPFVLYTDLARSTTVLGLGF